MCGCRRAEWAEVLRRTPSRICVLCRTRCRRRGRSAAPAGSSTTRPKGPCGAARGAHSEQRERRAAQAHCRAGRATESAAQSWSRVRARTLSARQEASWPALQLALPARQSRRLLSSLAAPRLPSSLALRQVWKRRTPCCRCCSARPPLLARPRRAAALLRCCGGGASGSCCCCDSRRSRAAELTWLPEPLRRTHCAYNV